MDFQGWGALVSRAASAALDALKRGSGLDADSVAGAPTAAAAPRLQARLELQRAARLLRGLLSAAARAARRNAEAAAAAAGGGGGGGGGGHARPGAPAQPRLYDVTWSDLTSAALEGCDVTGTLDLTSLEEGEEASLPSWGVEAAALLRRAIYVLRASGAPGCQPQPTGM
jgi:hypothetical protein